MELLRRRREQIEAREKRAPGEMPIATCLDRLEHDGTTACLPAEGLSASPRALVPREARGQWAPLSSLGDGEQQSR